jgi:ABC-2 type transport system ATP-binding protein
VSRTILKINNLTKIYNTGKSIIRALDGVTFDIYKGEIFGLLGVNGAGKTTLSSILATLHPPTSGSVLFWGTSIYDELMEYRMHLGFCPQKQNLDMFLNVKENLIFAGRYHLIPKKELEERVIDIMEQLEITKYAPLPISELSGGNKQRVLLARALIHKPSIIILDEPTVGLDPDIRRKLWEQIKQLKELGITVILTTHYLDEAELLSDRVCILNKGKILRIESTQTLKKEFNMASLEDIFLQLMKNSGSDQVQ